MDDVIKSMQENIKELYTRVTALEIGSGRFDEKLNTIKNTLDELYKKVSELAAIPGKRWDTIITIIITAICSGAIGAVISQLAK
jgi:hypothetical protein